MDDKSEELDKEFSETVDFQTNIRGIKVRGSYNTMKEAQIRSEVLKRKDKNHNIYIAQVGCWCPWDPNPNDIQDQHYSEDKLNTLMKKYRENQQHKDEVFEERKNEMLELQKEKNKLSNTLLENTELETTENVVLDGVKETIKDVVKTGEDVEKTVTDIKTGNVVEGLKDVVNDVEDIKEVVNDVKKLEHDINEHSTSVMSNTGIGEDNSVTENYNQKGASSEKVFEGKDPWLDRKEL
jgi:hypothetical protein